eukprot:4137660-Amphidinium_carterae.1
MANAIMLRQAAQAYAKHVSHTAFMHRQWTRQLRVGVQVSVLSHASGVGPAVCSPNNVCSNCALAAAKSAARVRREQRCVTVRCVSIG